MFERGEHDISLITAMKEVLEITGVIPGIYKAKSAAQSTYYVLLVNSVMSHDDGVWMSPRAARITAICADGASRYQDSRVFRAFSLDFTAHVFSILKEQNK